MEENNDAMCEVSGCLAEPYWLVVWDSSPPEVAVCEKCKDLAKDIARHEGRKVQARPLYGAASAS